MIKASIQLCYTSSGYCSENIMFNSCLRNASRITKIMKETQSVLLSDGCFQNPQIVPLVNCPAADICKYRGNYGWSAAHCSLAPDSRPGFVQNSELSSGVWMLRAAWGVGEAEDRRLAPCILQIGHSGGRGAARCKFRNCGTF